MGRPRFFVDALSGGDAVVGADIEAPLPTTEAHHARRVLRLRIGDEVEIVVAPGSVLTVRLDESPVESLRGTVLAVASPDPVSSVTLFQGMAKGDKLDLVIEKVVEIGVTGVVPVIFERSIVRLDADRAHARGERLRRVALAAARQSKRAHVPEVSDPLPASAVPALLSAFDVVLVAWEDAGAAPGIPAALAEASPLSSKIAVIVGPEGGLSSYEVEALLAAGARVVSLGSTVLRTETAGIVAVALAVYAMGGMGAPCGMEASSGG
ncbi:MAG: RsmE family RNA methyltransferase [Coriobacteriia bacterium]|nr:RsmE family RNA methyltransferase [Coriobacteriia bacterium]